jgi:hypothetical protein
MMERLAGETGRAIVGVYVIYWAQWALMEGSTSKERRVGAVEYE